MSIQTQKITLAKLSFLFAFVAAFAFLALKFPTFSSAASLDNFHPGNIISDYTMSNVDTMSVSDIQHFLTEKGNCNDTATYRADWYPSVHYHIENGHFVCLADERFATSGTHYGDTLESGESSQTAAEIIYEVAHEYEINPQVLIVLLQKEQGLITDSWPNSTQYRSATGYGCPDTAACDSKYYGFKNQLKNAAALFRTVLDGGWTNYPLGENYIYYNPNRDCGGSVVNIENLATSSLYRYTPYQPNSAALAAGYGTVSCGAYGNRNFYLYFMDWFGDPTVTVKLPTKEEVSASVSSVEALPTDLELEYRSSVKRVGWLDWVSGGQASGSSGYALLMDAFAVRLSGDNTGISYRSHIQDLGWESTFHQDGDISGESGSGKRIEAIQLKLNDELSSTYDIYYRAHVQDIGWMDWVKNGEIAGTTGKSKRLEALEIKLIQK
ncbi:hypothetical protein IJI72_02015 [Candidatus Saccharibacteria bacterium]|nr:hypothetical protein [Candidatus Saccharibacteria bacterium]